MDQFDSRPFWSPVELLHAFDRKMQFNSNDYCFQEHIVEIVRKGGPFRTLEAIGAKAELFRDPTFVLFMDWLDGRFNESFPLSNHTLNMLRPFAWRFARVNRPNADMARELMDTVFVGVSLDSWGEMPPNRRRKRRKRGITPIKSVGPEPPSRERAGAYDFLPGLGFTFAPRPVDILWAFAVEAQRTPQAGETMRAVLEFARESDMPGFISQLADEKDLLPEQVLAIFLYYLRLSLSHTYFGGLGTLKIIERAKTGVSIRSEDGLLEFFTRCFPRITNESWLSGASRPSA